MTMEFISYVGDFDTEDAWTRDPFLWVAPLVGLKAEPFSPRDIVQP
jgi:hypothetical protein